MASVSKAASAGLDYLDNYHEKMTQRLKQVKKSVDAVAALCVGL